MNIFAILLSRYLTFFEKHKFSTFLLFTSIILYTYLAVGAFIFKMSEGEEYKNAQKSVMAVKNKILQKYPNMPAEVLDDFMSELTIIGIKGLPRRNSTSEWTFSESWFFVVTLVTTVGYGNFTPKTVRGKVFCIVYTSIGIPLALFQYALLVDFFMKLSEKYKRVLFSKYQGKIASFYIRLVHATTIMAGIVLVIFILPAALFSLMEKDWGLFDGIYYCFISMTTVGLGDLVPTMEHNTAYAELYIFGSSFYLLLGLPVIMFMMAMWTDFFRNYNSDYYQLPFTVSTEKFPINSSTVHTYGSILTQSGKSETDEKILVSHGQLPI